MSYEYVYQLKASAIPGSDWVTVSKEDWIKAERAAGFRPALWSGHPDYMTTCATGGFSSSAGVAGQIVPVSTTPTSGRIKVPEGQTPLNDDLKHRLLDVFSEGMKARKTGTSSPYHGHSLEHCLYASGWVQQDLRMALDVVEKSTSPTLPVGGSEDE